MSKIILLGATGYQGKMVAQALLKRKAEFIIAGRNSAKLRLLSEHLGGVEFAVADAAEPESLSRLLGAGDVLASTAGPFWNTGESQIKAALASKAHYLDTSGEPAYIRRIYDAYGAAVKSAGVAAFPSCAYDFFPGNLASYLAMKNAGESAAKVQIGYFGELPKGYDFSSGSKASAIPSMFEAGTFWRDGAHVLGPVGTKLTRVDFQGQNKYALSMAGSEHYLLPPLFPNLRDIQGLWGWGENRSPAMCAAFNIAGWLGQIRRIKIPLAATVSKHAKSDGSGPTQSVLERASSYVFARSFDQNDRLLAEVYLGDIDGFLFTGNILAWTAHALQRGSLRETGLVHPVTAFGLEALIQGHKECGYDKLSFTNTME